MIPGEIQVAEGDIELNAGRPTVSVTVANTGDRPRITSYNVCYTKLLRFPGRLDVIKPGTSICLFYSSKHGCQ